MTRLELVSNEKPDAAALHPRLPPLPLLLQLPLEGEASGAPDAAGDG